MQLNDCQFLKKSLLRADNAQIMTNIYMKTQHSNYR